MPRSSPGPKFTPDDDAFIAASQARSPAVAVWLLATLTVTARKVIDRRCLAGVVLVKRPRELLLYPLDATDDAFLAVATEWHEAHRLWLREAGAAGTHLPLSLWAGEMFETRYAAALRALPSAQVHDLAGPAFDFRAYPRARKKHVALSRWMRRPPGR